MMRRRNKIRVVAPVRKLFLKRGDNVKVLAGNDRGKQGVVKSVDRRGMRAIVEGCRLVKRHVKPTKESPSGKIEEKEMFIHLSNLMLTDSKTGEVTRVGRRRNDKNKLERYAKKTGNIIVS